MTFSRSPTIGSPSRISNSLLTALSSLLTVKVAGPAVAFRSVGSQPSSVIVTAELWASRVGPSPTRSRRRRAGPRGQEAAAAIVSGAQEVGHSSLRFRGVGSVRPGRRPRHRPACSRMAAAPGSAWRATGAPGLRPEDVGQHRDQVGEVEEGFGLGHDRLQAEHPGQQGRGPGAGHDEPGEVDGLVLEAGQPAGLPGGVGGAREQAGGDEDEHDRGELEELGEVEVNAAAVDAVADQGGAEHAEHGADAGAGRVGRALEDGEQEDDGLDALAEHREEGHADQRDRRALGQRVGGGCLQVALQVPRVAPHPEDHEGDDADRHQARSRSPASPAGAAAAPGRRG